MKFFERWKLPLLAGLCAWILWAGARPALWYPGNLTVLSDIWDYAQQGRELYRGHGFTSLFTYPVVYGQNPAGVFANLWRPPLYPLLISLGFKLAGGPSIHVLAVLGGLFMALTVVLISRFAEELLESPYGWTIGIIYALTPAVFKAAFSGLSEPLYGFLVLMTFYLFYRLEKTAIKDWKLPLGIGMVLGLSWLARSESLFLVPVFLGFIGVISPKEKRWLNLSVFLGGLILVMSPWWIRNAMLTGNPFFNMSHDLWAMFTKDYPGWYRFRLAGNETLGLGYLFTHLPELSFKFIKYLVYNFKGILKLHTLMVPIFFIGFIWTNIKTQTRTFQTLMLALALTWLGISCLESDPRFFLGLLPVIIVFAGYFLWKGIVFFSGIIKLSSKLILIIYMAALAIPVISLWTGKSIAGVQERSQAEEAARVATIENITVDKKMVVLTDAPDLTAWYGDRRTAWLPVMKDLPQLTANHPEIKGIYLTHHIYQIADDPDIRQWKKIYGNAGDIPGFHLTRIYPDSSLYYERD